MRDRLLFNDDGKSLDEICFTGAIHLEQEDDDAYYLAIYENDEPNARYALFNLYAEPYIGEDEEGNPAVKVRLVVSERDADWSLFPLVQRHLTTEEVDARTAETDPDWHATLKDERPKAIV